MYCPYLYASIHINPAGKIRPCCRYRGYLENDQKDLNIKNIFFGETMTNVRSSFDSLPKNEFRQSCFRCLVEEKNGIRSLRERYPYETDGKELQMVEILFSNVCNFKCRTCNSGLSTRWLKDDTILNENEIFRERDPFPKVELSNIIYDGIDTVKYMKITGGEPFLYKGLEENLYNIVENNKDCWLWIFTNGSIFPDDNIIKIMKRFKKVIICVSVDGYEKVNEYIRHGSNWLQTVDVIKKWKSTGFKILLSTVVSAYSLPRLKEIIDWWNDKERHGFIYLQMPEYLDINVLSNEVLHKAKLDLSGYNLPFIPLLNNVKHVENKKFKLFTEALDEIRGEDYESIL
jgi:sulfatase maturation enzyme AslB (radical SAM superfamily)